MNELKEIVTATSHAGRILQVFETIHVLQIFGQLGVRMVTTFGLQHMENLMEEVLDVSLMDVLLASLSLKLICKRILTEGTFLQNYLTVFT